MEMLAAEFILSPMNTRQVFAILVIYTRVLGSVADSLQERRFSRISPTDYKDTKARIFLAEIIGVLVAHRRRGWGLRNDLHCVRRVKVGF